MDQPTNIELTITGAEEDVKRAALAAQRRIEFDTEGFKEDDYVFGDGIDFKAKMDRAVTQYGYSLLPLKDGGVRFASEQESYGCVSEEDIKEIAVGASSASPHINLHLEACITIYSSEGYDVYVTADYAEGVLNVESSEEYFDDEDEDEEDEDEENEDDEE